MDPITATALAVKAVAELLCEMIKGQGPEEKAQMWKWYVEDMERFRKFWKID